MPAPARFSIPVKQTTPIKSTPAIAPKTPASIPRHKTRVMPRRRGHRRQDDTDTDEDPIREPRSDDSSNGASSTMDSESETVSESEPEPEPEEHDATRVLSPSRVPLTNGTVSLPSSPPVEKPSAFPQSVDWSEIVAEENATGAVDIPVIDFANLSGDVERPSAASPAVPSPPPSSVRVETSRDASASQTTRRKSSQSARQAYRKRLDTDPAYVPTLGQFWSHDDRLLDKDLRSLSGWWRGRWQGRGRGRGFGGGWGTRGARGGGNFGRGSGPFSMRGSQVPMREDAPVERAWTHDGFEEMKKVDEERRKQHPFRGRSGPRSRGTFYRHGRLSEGSSVSVRAPSESQQTSLSDILRFGAGTRPWFAMKPERMWTKQFDAYLYFEAPLKPIQNQGLGQGVRIRLPGRKGEDEGEMVVRLPIDMAGPSRPVVAAKELCGERTFVVNLPRGEQTGQAHDSEDVPLTPEDFITVAPAPIEDSVPSFSPPPAAPVETCPTEDSPISSPTHHPQSQVSTSVQVTTTEAPQAFVPLSVSNDIPAAGPSHLSSNASQEAHTLPPTSLPATATAFLPSPPYGSSYGYPTPGHPLPPGIAISESGVTYEIATGRAVFLHTPPPPPPALQMQGTLYNPRPTHMHHAHHGGVHFLPPPLPHHASISPPGFLASPPIFALPRQSSRVEIRAPGEKGKEREETARARLPARSAVNINAEPFTPAAQAPSAAYYGSEGHTSFDEHHQFAYQPAPAPYYYPLGLEGSAPYGYGQYAPVDAGQPQQYEQYMQDSYPQQHQHTGYY